MSAPPPAHEMEDRLGQLLRAGVVAAAAVVVCGGALYLVRHGHEHPDYRTFHGETQDLLSVPGILQGVAELHARAVIQFGLLLLIATPVARVAAAGYGFARQGDWLYAGIAAIVLILILAGGV